MTEKSIIQYCENIGSDHLLVQGAGGNISWKEENILWVKASGARISDATKKNIFVPLDLFDLNNAIRNNEFDIQPKVLMDYKLRPSIETFLHALMKHKIVIHLHAVDILSYLVRKNYHEILKNKLKEIIWIDIPYVKPGANLAKLIKNTITPNTEAIFLQNHGLVIGGNSINEVDNILKKITSLLKITKHSCIKKNNSKPVYNIELNNIKYTLINDENINLLATTDLFKYLSKKWAISPDHVVFLDSSPRVYTSIKDFQTNHFNEKSRCELAFIKGEGVYITDKFNLAMREQLRLYFEILIRQSNLDDINTLNDKEIHELVNWDAEKYRISLQEK